MRNKTKHLIYSLIAIAAMAAAAPGSLPVFGGAALAGPARAVFDNGSNVEQFKKTVKKDIFYLPDEKFSKDFEIGPARPKTETQAQYDPKKAGRGAPGTKQPSDENFKVEAIIKIGEKGCAVINSKLWYVGKNSFGYMLMKLNDESVEIKTPAGNVIKCELIKKKAVETIDE